MEPTSLFHTIDVVGFYLPPVVIWVAAALVPYLVLRRIAEWSGFYRLVWHRPLFDAALYVIIVGALIYGLPILSGEMIR